MGSADELIRQLRGAIRSIVKEELSRPTGVTPGVHGPGSSFTVGADGRIKLAQTSGGAQSTARLGSGQNTFLAFSESGTPTLMSWNFGYLSFPYSDDKYPGAGFDLASANPGGVTPGSAGVSPTTGGIYLINAFVPWSAIGSSSAKLAVVRSSNSAMPVDSLDTLDSITVNTSAGAPAPQRITAVVYHYELPSYFGIAVTYTGGTPSITYGGRFSMTLLYAT